METRNPCKRTRTCLPRRLGTLRSKKLSWVCGHVSSNSGDSCSAKSNRQIPYQLFSDRRSSELRQDSVDINLRKQRSLVYGIIDRQVNRRDFGCLQPHPWYVKGALSSGGQVASRFPFKEEIASSNLVQSIRHRTLLLVHTNLHGFESHHSPWGM